MTLYTTDNPDDLFVGGVSAYFTEFLNLIAPYIIDLCGLLIEVNYKCS